MGARQLLTHAQLRGATKKGCWVPHDGEEQRMALDRERLSRLRDSGRDRLPQAGAEGQPGDNCFVLEEEDLANANARQCVGKR